MSGSKATRPPIILIGGGDSYTQRADFLTALRTQPLHDAPSDEPYASWKQHFVAELEAEYWIDIPQMPNKQNARYDEWQIWFQRHLELVEREVILIGLSLGAMFLVKYLLEEPASAAVRHLFLLAGPCGSCDDGTGNDCSDFAFAPADLPQLTAQVGGITIMHSTDDFVVPYQHAERYAAALPQAELVTFADKNHFLIPEFPELIERVRAVM